MVKSAEFIISDAEHLFKICRHIVIAKAANLFVRKEIVGNNCAATFYKFGNFFRHILCQSGTYPAVLQ